MIADGLLTKFQAGQLLKGKHRGFVLGKYKLLDRIGMGGMGQVFLAEHTLQVSRFALCCFVWCVVDCSFEQFSSHKCQFEETK